MVTMLYGFAQPGIFPAIIPTAVLPVGGVPLVALVPLAFLGAGLASVLVLIAKERWSRISRRFAVVRPGESSLSEAA